ncbi:hypothetical protein SLS60_002292 [Paraconiothyrium brasiliense]|uniref:Amidohydrolase-related domain-containing protein n=1 Tax=Paraconiothyrium brasiliense TaxID=300254 RepID=A0ABR3S1R3_9PLEO
MRVSTYLFEAFLSTSFASACFSHAKAAVRDAVPLNRRSYPPPIGRTAIKDVRVFDGVDFTPPQTIVIEDDQVGSFDTGDVNTTVNGTGKFLIPGLMDSHIHLSQPTDLELLTSYGITTVFQMSCFNYTACNMFRGHTGLCDFYTAGASAVGNGSSHSKQFNVPPSLLWFPNSDAVEYVDNAFNNGSDYYKITVEENGPTLSAQVALVQAVHSLGKQVMSHAATIKNYYQAIESGTNGPQHIPQDGLLNTSAILKMKQQHQFATPTMTVFHYGLVEDPSKAPQLGSPNGSDYEYVRANVGLLHSFGVPILAGTDSIGQIQGAYSMLTLPHGETLHRELQLLVDAGLSEAEAINAATSVPAEWHQKFDRGVIAPGKRADLLLLNSNPLENINNTMDISRVWVQGIEYTDVAKNRDAWASQA